MSAVLSAIAGDNFIDSIVTTKREGDLDDVITRLHEHENSSNFLLLVFQSCALLDALNEGLFDDLAAAMIEVFNLN